MQMEFPQNWTFVFICFYVLYALTQFPNQDEIFHGLQNLELSAKLIVKKVLWTY